MLSNSAMTCSVTSTVAAFKRSPAEPFEAPASPESTIRRRAASNSSRNLSASSLCSLASFFARRTCSLAPAMRVFCFFARHGREDGKIGLIQAGGIGIALGGIAVIRFIQLGPLRVAVARTSTSCGVGRMRIFSSTVGSRHLLGPELPADVQ
jgi:hypothetical protein